MFHTFTKGISSKVNVIACLEFELDYFKGAVQHFSHYITGKKLKILPWIKTQKMFSLKKFFRE